MEINEDSLWDATSESQRNRKRKNRKRFKKTSEKQVYFFSTRTLYLQITPLIILCHLSLVKLFVILNIQNSLRNFLIQIFLDSIETIDVGEQHFMN